MSKKNISRIIISFLLVFGLVVVFSDNRPAYASTTVVTNANTSGAGSFRQAILDANANPGADNIQFDIPGVGPHNVILPQLTVTGEVHIDATVGNGGSTCATSSAPAKPNVILNVNNAWNQPLIFDSSSAGSSLKGVSYANAPQGMQLNANNFTMTCSFVDMTPNGAVSAVRGGITVGPDLSNLSFGGSSIADRNYFSGTSLVAARNVSGLVFENNYVGTNPTGDDIADISVYNGGLLRLCNSGNNIDIKNNVISGVHHQFSIAFIAGYEGCNGLDDLTNVSIAGNKIGTNAAGDDILSSDGLVGVELQHYEANTMSDITIGGPNPEDRNIFAGNRQAVRVIYEGGPTNDVHIENNYMGVGVDGEALGSLPEYTTIETTTTSSDWVIKNNVISGSSSQELIMRGNGHSVTGNKIGVNASATANVGSRAGAIIIAGNNSVYSNNTIGGFVGRGIDISGEGNVIKSNYIGTNPGLNADLSTTSTTASPIFSRQYDGTIYGGRNNIIGGVGASDGNYVYNFTSLSTNYNALDAYYAESGTNSTTVLGNRVVNNGNRPINSFGSPKITNITESGGETTYEVEINTNFTDGDYRLEFFENPTAKNAQDQLDTTERVGSANVTKVGANRVEATISGTSYTYPTITATKLDSSSDGFGLTSNVGEYQMETDLQVSTQDNIDYVQENSTGHEITQTITNLGPSTVTDLSFTLYSSDCFDTTSVSTSGTATDAGAYSSEAWSGQLQEGQTLILTFTGDITCNAGSNMYFDHPVAVRYNNGANVLEVTHDNNVNANGTAVVYTTDLQIETTDGKASVDAGTTGHEFKQTYTNLGPSAITDISIGYSGSNCFNVTGTATSGTATDVGSYDSSAWSGVLEPGQNMTITFTGDITCGGGSKVEFYQWRNGLENSGQGVVELDYDNDQGYDETDITGPETDLSITKTLDNPQDVEIGGVLKYTLTLTNNGPDDIDLGSYDSSGQNPFATSLFIDVMPFELNFVSGSSTNGNIDCSQFPMDTNNPSASPIFPNHPDHNIVACSYAAGSNTLSANQSISTTISATVDASSDLDFTNHLISGWTQNDPDFPTIESAFGGGNGACVDAGYTDMIDCYAGLDINNYAFTVPSADLRIEKNLVNTGDIHPGDNVSYDITLSNDGPMPLDLTVFDGSQQSNGLFNDLFPGADLTFVDDNNNDITCYDVGPGSIVYLGNAGEDHPDHQILSCVYTGASQILAVDGSLTVRLSFTADAGVGTSFTNYVVNTGLSTDLDSAIALNSFSAASGDILDTFTNENFAKAIYTSSDSDSDGITNAVEDAGPNGGDANNDGTLDSLQDNVTSLVNGATGKRTVLEVSDVCTISSIDVLAESENADQDSTYNYPVGLMDFKLDCGTPGYTADIAQYYFDANDQNYIVRKYDTRNNSYSTIEEATVTTETIGGKSVVKASYEIKDGGALDMDGIEDGNIVDPAGLAVADDGSSQAVNGSGILSNLTNGLASTGESVKTLIGVALALVATSGIVIFRKYRKRK